MARKRPRRDAEPSRFANRPIFYQNDVLPDVLGLLSRHSPFIRNPLANVMDDRLWTPTEFIDERSFSTRRAVIKTDRNVNKSGSKRHAGMSLKRIQSTLFSRPFQTFANPRFVVRCIRRKVRKEVLHALKKTGKGAGPRRRPRFTEASKVKC